MQAVLLTMCAVAAADAVPESCVLRTAEALRRARADLPVMAEAADAAAARLADGGKLYASGQPSMVSELCGRAGGLMLIQRLGSAVPQEGDVVLFSRPNDDEIPPALLSSGALVIVLGSNPADGVRFAFLNYSQETGVSPTLANAIPGWLFTGELIAALTRLGKMPVVYESIGAYGGYPRIERYQKKGVFWHEEHAVPPIQAGEIGARFIETVTAFLERVEREQRPLLEQTARWAADAKRNGHQLIMYSMGHLFPAEVQDTAIGEVFESAVWQSGFMQQALPDHTYAEGDVLIHIGYQHPPYRLLDRARPAGARVAYVDVMRHRDYANDPGVIWIDPMWPWADGCVEIEGYDVPALPASGIVNGAIAWEIHRLTQVLLDSAASGKGE